VKHFRGDLKMSLATAVVVVVIVLETALLLLCALVGSVTRAH